MMGPRNCNAKIILIYIQGVDSPHGGDGAGVNRYQKLTHERRPLMSEKLSEILDEEVTGGPQPSPSEDEEPSALTETAEEMDESDMDEGDDDDDERGAFDHF
jgi:hypothetical protein